MHNTPIKASESIRLEALKLAVKLILDDNVHRDYTLKYAKLFENYIVTGDS